MNKTFKKVLCGVLCVCAASGALAGCGGGDDFQVNMDIDLTQKIDLNVLMPNSGETIEAMRADSTVAVVEEVTGYHVNYSQLASANADSTLSNNLINRSEYHLVKMTTAQFGGLVQQGALLPLNDVLDKFGPAIKSAISDESWDVVTVNGKIYGIPERASSDNVEHPIVMRQDWLDKLNLSMPTDAASFKSTLQAFKTANSEGKLTANGSVMSDFVPFTFDNMQSLVYPISASFGIYSEWQEYEVNGQTKVLHYMQAPNYDDYVEYMADLMDEGLVDASFTTQDNATAMSKFNGGKAGAIATSIWTMTAVVSGLQSNGIISANEAAGTLENYLCYVRSLDGGYTGKFYRSGGYTYVTAIPHYMAENAGYAIDWVNSKLTDTDDNHNFRDIVIGKESEGTWTYNDANGYIPTDKFSSKEHSDWFLTGSNENVYTTYWKARVRKNAELFRAWEELMDGADEYGVYNVVDFIPPIYEYSACAKLVADDALAAFQEMVYTNRNAANLSAHLAKFVENGGESATDAINAWYASK